MARQGVILLKWVGRGPMDRDLLERVRQEVEASFLCPARLAAVNGRPPECQHPGRRQHSSTKLLHWIRSSATPGVVKVLGITDVDLCIPVLTFVFGEARLNGVAAVVSTARLRLTCDERPASPALLEVRLRKECLHELGHTFGLVHCSDAACVMSRSNSILDVDQKRARFCRDCRRRVRAQTEEGDRP